ncbi:MAG: hypothetical protein HYV13_00635 [Candidatus Doudnabacteria bacterium]|nr:hypothetical protein [Candidatus Doudnabacteria bacterium]
MDIEKEIGLIKERNRKVEADKAWEISWTRRLFITAVIYIIAGVWLVLIHEAYSWLKAFVPAVGYLFSTFSLPILKSWWSKAPEKNPRVAVWDLIKSKMKF